MRTLGPLLVISSLLWITGSAGAQQPTVPTRPSATPGAATAALSNEATLVTAQKFQFGQRIRAMREARANKRSGLLGGLRNRLHPATAAPSTPTPAAPTPAR